MWHASRSNSAPEIPPFSGVWSSMMISSATDPKRLDNWLIGCSCVAGVGPERRPLLPERPFQQPNQVPRIVIHDIEVGPDLY